jgi:CRP-like cAMP-binding protein
MDGGRLAAIAFFAGLAQHELDVVARAATELDFDVGSPLTTQGEFGHALFVIDSGTAEVSADGSRLGEVGPGDVVGEVAVLASGRRTASVVATSRVQAFAWFKRDVWALDTDAPEAAARLRAALDEHVASRRAE